MTFAQLLSPAHPQYGKIKDTCSNWTPALAEKIAQLCHAEVQQVSRPHHSRVDPQRVPCKGLHMSIAQLHGPATPPVQQLLRLIRQRVWLTDQCC